MRWDRRGFRGRWISLHRPARLRRGDVAGGKTAVEKQARLSLSCTLVLIVNLALLSSLQKQNPCTAICIAQTASPLPHSQGFILWKMRRLCKINIALQLRLQILHCLQPLCVWRSLSLWLNENNGPQIIYPYDSETRERYRPATAVADGLITPQSLPKDRPFGGQRRWQAGTGQHGRNLLQRAASSAVN